MGTKGSKGHCIRDSSSSNEEQSLTEQVFPIKLTQTNFLKVHMLEKSSPGRLCKQTLAQLETDWKTVAPDLHHKIDIAGFKLLMDPHITKEETSSLFAL